jgi:hypothetical protein
MTDEKSLVVQEQRLTVRYPSLQQWQLFERFALAIQASHEFGLKSPEEVVVKAQFCWDYGLPLSSFSSLYIISKRVAVMSDLIAERLSSHPDYEYDVDEHTDDKCTITVWRRSKRTGEFTKAGSSTYTMDDAHREKLDTKDAYKKVPRNMMFARAITNAYKWYARNIFNVPVNTIEEFGYNEDTIEVEYQAIEELVNDQKTVVVKQSQSDNQEVVEEKTEVEPVSDVPQYNIPEPAQLMELVKWHIDGR